MKMLFFGQTSSSGIVHHKVTKMFEGLKARDRAGNESKGIGNDGAKIKTEKGQDELYEGVGAGLDGMVQGAGAGLGGMVQGVGAGLDGTVQGAGAGLDGTGRCRMRTRP